MLYYIIIHILQIRKLRLWWATDLASLHRWLRDGGWCRSWNLGMPEQGSLMRQTVLLSSFPLIFPQFLEDKCYCHQFFTDASLHLARLCFRKCWGFLGDAKGMLLHYPASLPWLVWQFLVPVSVTGPHSFGDQSKDTNESWWWVWPPKYQFLGFTPQPKAPSSLDRISQIHPLAPKGKR